MTYNAYDVMGDKLAVKEGQEKLIPHATLPHHAVLTRRLGNRFATTIGGDVLKMANGEYLPADEPLFVIRGRDHLAVKTLLHYAELCKQDGCTDYIMKLLDESIAEFEAFRVTSPGKMKQPGITRGK